MSQIPCSEQNRFRHSVQQRKHQTQLNKNKKKILAETHKKFGNSISYFQLYESF